MLLNTAFIVLVEAAAISALPASNKGPEAVDGKTSSKNHKCLITY